MSYAKRISNLKLINLQAFTCAAEYGSFSKAAMLLHVTQPSISRRIEDLEQTLNLKLFDRIGNKIYLTEAGTILFDKSKTILDLVDEAQHSINQNIETVSGSLSIGVSGYIAESHFRPLLKSFVEQYPKVKLDINLFGSTSHSYTMLEKGTADLLFGTLPINKRPGFEFYKVWQDELVYVATQGHPLSLMKKVSLRQLVKYPAVLPDTGTQTRTIIDEIFSKKHLTIQQAFQVPKSANFPILKMMVSLGLGWSLLPKLTLDETFTILPIIGKNPKRELGIIKLSGRTLSSAAKALFAVSTTENKLG